MKWYNFKPNIGANRQKLPKEKKYVLVRKKNLDESFPDPIVVGYLKYHAGVKQEPYFVTPGATLEKSPIGDESTVQWCDCLPDDFKWYTDTTIDTFCQCNNKSNLNDAIIGINNCIICGKPIKERF